MKLILAELKQIIDNKLMSQNFRKHLLLFSHAFTLISVIVIQLLVTLFYTSQLSSVKYSFIGDEYATYYFAKDISTGNTTPNPFSLNGVYEENPVLGSYYQAAIMKIFGENIYVWKIASLLIIFPIGLVIFYLMKKMSNITAAYFSLLLIDFSFYY